MNQTLVKPIDILNSALNSEAKSTLKGLQIIHKLGLYFDSVNEEVVAPHIPNFNLGVDCHSLRFCSNYTIQFVYLHLLILMLIYL